MIFDFMVLFYDGFIVGIDFVIFGQQYVLDRFMPRYFWIFYNSIFGTTD